MRWYSTFKSILFRDRRNARNRTTRRRHETLKLPSLPQPAMVGALDRRAIRLRRD